MDQDNEPTAAVSACDKEIPEDSKIQDSTQPRNKTNEDELESIGDTVKEVSETETSSIKVLSDVQTSETVEITAVDVDKSSEEQPPSLIETIENDTIADSTDLQDEKRIDAEQSKRAEEPAILEKNPTIEEPAILEKNPTIEITDVDGDTTLHEMSTLAANAPTVEENPSVLLEESKNEDSEEKKKDCNIEESEVRSAEQSPEPTVEPSSSLSSSLTTIEKDKVSEIEQNPTIEEPLSASNEEPPVESPAILTSDTIPEPSKLQDNDDKTESHTMEVDLDSTDKDESAEKSVVEPESTEFIQFTQDKQDDTQNESQSMDAEDPFGGDSLADGTAETLENDQLEQQDINFCKLSDQADNLQDVLKSKDVTFKTTEIIDIESDPIEETTKDIADDVSNDSIENKAPDDSTATTADTSTAVNTCTDSSQPDKTCESDKNKKDNDDVITSEEQSTVLPGQDDELCIIPDNMKIVLPKSNTTTQNDTVDIEESTSKPTEEVTITTDVVVHETPEVTEVTESPTEICELSQPVTQSLRVIAEGVIDVEDDGKNTEIQEIETLEICKQCKAEKSCKIMVKLGNDSFNVCSKECQAAFATENNRATDIPSDGANSKYEKRCANCLLLVETNDERNLSWETMEFCNEECLGKFQTKYGSYCRNCNGSVAAISLGKYCVRFGYDVRQFCCSTCLEEFKKGLKVCSYCQKDISTGTGFLAPVGDKGQFKDFCTQFCMEKYSKMNSTEPPSAETKTCSVCQEEKIVHCEVQLDRSPPVAICSELCFAAFKFVNKVDPNQCSTCKKYFEQVNKKSIVVFDNDEAHTFCNKTCLNIYIITHRKIVPCNWCKVKKYNFDMIKKDLKNGNTISMCSLNCLTLYQVSVNAVSARRIHCDYCKEFLQAQYHLTMSDATIRNFCTYDCVMKFQGQYTKSPITIPAGDDSAPVPTGTPKRTYPGKLQTQASTVKPVEISNLANLTNLTTLTGIQSLQGKKNLPVISSVTSLASNGQSVSISQQKSSSTMTVATVNNASITNATVTAPGPQIIYKQQVITQPPSPVKIHNKMTQCKPLMHTKGVSVKPHPCNKSTQTDEVQKILVPIPVPIYVPFPVHMWSFPFPVPMPFPLPIPVPIFIPTTRNSAKGILKDIKRIQEKLPSDPFEAELLMMAEMVATDKKTTESDSADSDPDEPAETENVNSFGDDMLQMALKMATGEIEESVDLEVALTPNTISATPPVEPSVDGEGGTESGPTVGAATGRGKKRVVANKSRGGPVKRGRRTSASVNENTPLMPPPESQPAGQPRIVEPVEKPDANMALKYTFGVNAWRKWVIAKNNELEKQSTSTRKVKLFKTDLLQLTADELNYTLCLFVKEVRKPNGAEYAPDTIYYLCLGIQQYLFENNRIDNIFTDTYYEQFTDCLNDAAKKFSVLYNDAQYIVTRVEEEHLWECKQLGAHSPHVLLSTLMFFNTKHFNLVTVEEHMQLSFSHIMKHWKRNPAAQAAAVAGKAPGSRNVLLRFYPPASTLEANSKKKKVYEQQENEENPLRCPVKLYEFYLSKCPESVKTRNDVFYLLPERSCVPDSPVWYSTSALAKENLVKMLHRVKMVKEINVALLSP